MKASRPVVWYVVGIVRAPLRNKEKRCVPHSRGTAGEILEGFGFGIVTKVIGGIVTKGGNSSVG